MNRDKFIVSPAALLLWAFLYYIMDGKSFAALSIPILVHEIGHVIALFVFGLKVHRVRVELKGFCIDYSGFASPAEHMAIALSGPVAGVMFAVAASKAANSTGLEWLYMCSGVSLCLSVFNMLPVMPLDGGRALSSLINALCGEQKGRTVMDTLNVVLGLAMMIMGTVLMVKGKGAGLLIASVWVFNYQDSVVKRREIL